MKKVKLSITGMHGDECENSIKNALNMRAYWKKPQATRQEKQLYALTLSKFLRLPLHRLLKIQESTR